MNAHLRTRLLAGALCLLAAAAACGQDDTQMPTTTESVTPGSPSASGTPALLVPTPTPYVHGGAPDHIWYVSPSLEEQIFDSDAIVRASLVSATTSTETVPSDPGVAPTYRAVHELRFTVHEYLKGSGPAQVHVVVRDDHTFASAAEALSRAQQQLRWRTTTWDSRQGVLFLRTDQPHQFGGVQGDSGQDSRASSFEFTLSNPVVQTPWDYSIDTLSRAWLPANGVASGASGQTGPSGAVSEPVEFITDGTISPPPVVSLVELRSKVAELEATLRSGTGIEGFRKCVWGKIIHERHRRARPWTPIRREATLASGSAAGTEIDRKTDHSYYRFTQYRRFWLSGTHMELFRAVIDDDDSAPGNGYDHTFALARSLPAGEYRLNYNRQHYRDFPCNFVPDNYIEWIVTVTAPSDTLHEAFFDPVAIGSAVGADSSNGVLKPNAFSLDGTTTTISSLKWESGTATMTLNPSASLAGYAVDFIALDGSVTSTLAFDDATQSGGTLTLSIATRPWNAGDKLMLRIRTKPSIAISGLDASIEAGRSDAFTVSASNLATTTSYTIRVTTDNADIGFDTTCADRQEDTSVPAASASHSAAFTLRACSATGGTVTATLMQGTTAVATATQDVTVTAPPPPPPHAPAPTGLSVATTTQTTIRVSWNTVQDAHRYKLERSADGSSGWSNVDDGISGTSHTLTGLSCATTVHFRVSARGDGSPYSTTFGSPSTSVSGTTGDCPPTPVATPTPTTTAPSPPVFASSTYSFTVAENASAFHVVGQVSADDPDGGIVTYSIIAGNAGGKFNITHNAGEIVVRGALDHDTTSSYALTVRATDSSGATATAVVNISVTDVP